MKNILPISIIAIAVIAIIVVGMNRNNADQQTALDEIDNTIVDNQVEETMDEVENSAEVAGETENTAGIYTAYSEDLAATHVGKTVLFFKAAWCSTCRRLENDIVDNAENIPASVAILELDYDTEIAKRQQYGVTVQHTLVQIDNEGNLIKKWTGSPNLEQIVANII